MMSKMHLVLGVKSKYDTDAVRLLKHVLHRYSLFADKYIIEYVYETMPPTQAKQRKLMAAEARERLEAGWLEEPGPVIGLGWIPCEILTGRGKTKLKDRVGTRWIYVGSIDRPVWVCNDPAACLYNPNLVVDIAAVIRAAGKEAGFEMKVNVGEPAFDWQKWI